MRGLRPQNRYKSIENVGRGRKSVSVVFFVRFRLILTDIDVVGIIYGLQESQKDPKGPILSRNESGYCRYRNLIAVESASSSVCSFPRRSQQEL